jgi:hypothetical protein
LVKWGTPDQVAAQIRAVLKHLVSERHTISLDRGLARDGMSRRHAVALVLGTNIVREELSFPEAQDDDRRSLLTSAD